MGSPPVNRRRWSGPLARKRKRLEDDLRRMGRVVIAFSGGVDSTLLAAVAKRVLGDGVLAVTALSPSFPAREREAAERIAHRLALRHQEIASHEMGDRRFLRNPPDRCYYCKMDLFRRLQRIAHRGGYRYVLDGSNADDQGDYRPGRRAAREAGVRSPLLDAGLGKKEIRALSRALGLSTADKPSFACLASRLPYGCRITREELQRIDRAEDALLRLGFRQVRVRVHGDLARIELDPGRIHDAMKPTCRRRIAERVKAAGFRYVAIDLQGYRTGSMNEALPGATAAQGRA